MSYCRWSSDDWQCDVYAYESVGGYYQIHVAGRRRVPDVPLPPPIKFSNDNIEAWVKRDAEVSEIVNGRRKSVDRGDGMMVCTDEYEVEPRAHWVDLPEPHAGESYQCATLGGFLDKMIEIKSSGLNVPDGVIDLIREEIDELGPDYEPGGES